MTFPAISGLVSFAHRRSLLPEELRLLWCVIFRRSRRCPPLPPNIARECPAISHFGECTEKQLRMPLFAIMSERAFRDFGHRVLRSAETLKASAFLETTKRIDISVSYTHL